MRMSLFCGKARDFQKCQGKLIAELVKTRFGIADFIPRPGHLTVTTHFCFDDSSCFHCAVQGRGTIFNGVALRCSVSISRRLSFVFY